MVLKVASDIHPCDLTGDKNVFLQTSRTPPSGDLLCGLSKSQLLMLQNPQFDGTETMPMKLSRIGKMWSRLTQISTTNHIVGVS